MQVGIYIKEIKTEEGGGFTFESTILNEIDSIKELYDVTVLFEGKKFGRYLWQENGIRYINLTAYKLRNYGRFLKKSLSLFYRRVRRIISYRVVIDERVALLDELAKDFQIDIFWFTVPVLERLAAPYIYTLWDLGHRKLYMPETSRPLNCWMERETMYQEMLVRASYILVGNKVGEQEILENYRIPQERIRICPFEVPQICADQEEKPDVWLPEHYFIFPAQFWAHKNHICILKALKILKDEDGIEVNVVFVGSDKGNLSYIEKMTKEYGLEKQVFFLGFVSAAELKYLYMHADALIFASILGPNNLPPIEGAFFGIPVILTDIEGHREQMGDDALYFDGLNPSTLASVIKKFVNDKELRDRMKAKSKEFMEKNGDYKYIDGILRILDEFKIRRDLWNDS